MEAEFRRREQEVAQKAEKEMLEHKRELQIKEAERLKHQHDERVIDEKLVVVWPQVKEANTIATEMGRPYQLGVKLHTVFDRAEGRRHPDLRVEVRYDGTYLYDWHPDSLEARLVGGEKLGMRGLYDAWLDDPACLSSLLYDENNNETGQNLWDDPKRQNDPWYDPIDQNQLIGSAQCDTEVLIYKFDEQGEFQIISTDGSSAGVVKLHLVPLAQQGGYEIPEEEMVDEGEEHVLEGKPFRFEVNIESIVPNADSKEKEGSSSRPLSHFEKLTLAYTHFNFPTTTDDALAPIESQEVAHEWVFNHKKEFFTSSMNKQYLSHLREKPLVVEIHGRLREQILDSATKKRDLKEKEYIQYLKDHDGTPWEMNLDDQGTDAASTIVPGSMDNSMDHDVAEFLDEEDEKRKCIEFKDELINFHKKHLLNENFKVRGSIYEPF